MQYKTYKHNVKLSRLGMGNMRLPVIDGNNAEINYEEAKKIIDQCMKNGVNYYDTAYIYHDGKSEEFVGRAFAEYSRESYYIADKFNLQANPDYEMQFGQQLDRLNMDYIDFYLLHGIQDSFIDEILTNGCIEYFDNMKNQGKIRYLGFSYHGSAAELPRLLQSYPWDFVQIQLNYYDWYFGDAKELYEILCNAGIPVMVMEPVHGGLLANLTEKAASILEKAESDKSLASWAMRWVMSLNQVYVVLSGMSDTNQIEDNLRTFDEALPLTKENHEQIHQAAVIQHSAVAVACTACRYCCPDCPVGLDIPRLLRAYNEAKIGGAWRLSGLRSLPEEKLPLSCIECGSCTRHCPQGFEIPAYMNEMKKMLKSVM